MCPFRGTPAPTHPGVYLLHQGRQQFSPDSRTKVTLRIWGWGQSTVWRGLLATPPGFCSPEPGVRALFCVPCTCGVTGPGPGGPAFTGDLACTGPPRRHTSQGPWRGLVSPRAKSHTHSPSENTPTLALLLKIRVKKLQGVVDTGLESLATVLPSLSSPSTPAADAGAGEWWDMANRSAKACGARRTVFCTWSRATT